MMKASQTLLHGYSEHGRISLKNKTLLFWLNVLAVPWFLFCAFFFGIMTSFLRPLNFAILGSAFPQETPLGTVGTITVLFAAVLIILCIVLILHELTHGLFFWLFTKSRPVFGFKGWYAYASAPGWYLPRGQSLVVGGAPLILLSLLGEALLFLVPQSVALCILWGLIVNAGGAVGDLYMIVRLTLTPRIAVVEASRGEMTWYVPTKQFASLEEQQ
jgi:MFS family permease